jgi:hypothetical protein
MPLFVAGSARQETVTEVLAYGTAVIEQKL